MSAPRRSREVHAEPEWRRDKGMERYLGAARVARLLPRPVAGEPHGPVAECVCEEPCRYCRCEPT